MLRRNTKSKDSNRQKLYIFCLILIIFTLVHDKYSQKMLGASRNDQVQLSSLNTKVDLTPTVETPKLSLSPSTKDVIINIGSNIDPIMPPEDMGPCAHTIAVEPIVSCEFSHQQLSVIPAAVADQAGVMTMNVLNKKHSVSSSLAEVKANDWRLKGGTRKIVPVITLTSLLDSIPSTVNIAMMMTDIQGYDFRTVKAGAKAVKERVTHLVTEVSKEDKYSYDTQNDLCRDWIPFMEELGYTLIKVADIGDREKVKAFCTKWLEDHPNRPTPDENPGLVEDDAFWVRNDVKGQPFPQTTQLPMFKPNFTAEDYAKCA